MAETVLFGRYRLIAPAGSGGSASVWRALDERTGDEVAVKRLHPVVVADHDALRRLRREFRALRRLRGPHVARVRELHVEDGDAAIVLDYVAGRSLAERLSSGPVPIPPDEAVAIASDVASALVAAHEVGIVHRDVTPANILLGDDGRARLTDFGIALAADDAARSTAITATGLLVGTPRYVSPEQLRGTPATPGSDLYALAAVTYEMLAGRPAFSATAPVALASEQLDGPPPIPRVPAALDAAVRSGLAPDPRDRPADVDAFAAALEAAIGADLGRAATTVIPVAALQVGGVAAVEEPPDGAGRVAGRPDRPRLVGPIAAAGMVVLGAVLVAGAAGGSSPFDPVDIGRGDRRAAEPVAADPTAAPAASPSVQPVAGPDGGGSGKGNGDNARGKGKGKPPKGG